MQTVDLRVRETTHSFHFAVDKGPWSVDIGGGRALDTLHCVSEIGSEQHVITVGVL